MHLFVYSIVVESKLSFKPILLAFSAPPMTALREQHISRPPHNSHPKSLSRSRCLSSSTWRCFSRSSSSFRCCSRRGSGLSRPNICFSRSRIASTPASWPGPSAPRSRPGPSCRSPRMHQSEVVMLRWTWRPQRRQLIG